jgi:hypothetical protein
MAIDESATTAPLWLPRRAHLLMVSAESVAQRAQQH